jgi:hypothetical protein
MVLPECGTNGAYMSIFQQEHVCVPDGATRKPETTLVEASNYFRNVVGKAQFEFSAAATTSVFWISFADDGAYSLPYNKFSPILAKQGEFPRRHPSRSQFIIQFRVTVNRNHVQLIGMWMSRCGRVSVPQRTK